MAQTKVGDEEAVESEAVVVTAVGDEVAVGVVKSKTRQLSLHRHQLQCVQRHSPTVGTKQRRRKAWGKQASKQNNSL